MRKLTKGMVVFLAMLMVLAVLPAQTTSAQAYITLPASTGATVVSIVDVNAMVVRTTNGEALVRLIGVMPGGSQEAVNYLTQQLVGRNVILNSDPSLPIQPSNRWNYMYVHFDGRFINREVIEMGFALFNNAHYFTDYFSQMEDAEYIAGVSGMGFWATDMREPTLLRHHDRININTATQFQIANRLDIDMQLAQAIVAFRSTHPIRQASDLVFVQGMTSQIFGANRYRMGVSTNINTAAEHELATMFTVGVARNIVDSRFMYGAFTNIEQLVTRGVLTQLQFNTVEPFISVENDYVIDFYRPHFRANINLASHLQMTRAGASPAQAVAFINQRDILPLRNVQDLMHHPAFNIHNTNAIADNMRTHTNINTAPRSELESLFGTFSINIPNLNNAINRILEHREEHYFEDVMEFEQFMPAGAVFADILPFIYAYEPPVQWIINLNRATQAQLEAAGIPADTARVIANNPQRGSWHLPSQLPANIRNLPDETLRHLSLRTNINNATEVELLSLDPAMTPHIVERIERYLEEHPFGNAAAIRDFFDFMNLRPLHDRIAPHLILR
ncbi:MAG: helix-hairpin-helix domain-containing protein [Defluviitaleaceae bacterium]|nr:helix-hairpin-helix domain-containing protein [Defluviitaleaceae bacterium]